MKTSEEKQKSTSPLRRWLTISIPVVLLTGSLIGYVFYRQVFAPNISIKDQEVYLLIPTGSAFEEVVSRLQKDGCLQDRESFVWVARQMNYDRRVKPGRYRIRRGMSNRQLVSLLRSGQQSPVKLTFNNIRTASELAGIIGRKLEADSTELAELFGNEKFLAGYGFTRETGLCIIIPNTYEFYWNTSAQQFFLRMSREHRKFWTENRREKARQAGLNPEEAVILASIVEKESQMADERATIAGVYMNRLRDDWKLEADPTLVFASGDFTIRRVLNEHKKIDSPYNTYLHKGLPPGPICIPSISSVDAVLNYEKHNYYYFCARDDFSGYHSFAKTYSDHLLNARRFQKELNRRGIRS